MADPDPSPADWDHLLTCPPEVRWQALAAVRDRDPARIRMWVPVPLIEIDTD